MEFNREKILKRLYKDLADWVKRDLADPSLYFSVYEDLTEELGKSDSRSCMSAGIRATFVAVHEANRGANAVLKGDPQGWALLYQSLMFHYEATRLQIAASTKNGNPVPVRTCSFNDLALNFCLAIAWREEEVAVWYAHQLQTLYKNKLENEVSFDYPFREFIRVMCTIYPNRQGPGSKHVDAIGVYGKLFSAWEDNEKLSVVLDDACDYHLTRAYEYKGQSPDPAFLSTTYAVLPAEILAFLEYRRAFFGLTPPKCNHPLMNSLLINMPIEKVKIENPTLEKLIQKRIQCS